MSDKPLYAIQNTDGFPCTHCGRVSFFWTYTTAPHSAEDKHELLVVESAADAPVPGRLVPIEDVPPGIFEGVHNLSAAFREIEARVIQEHES